MNWKVALIGGVLAGFVALTGYAVYAVGLVGIFSAGTANWGAIQIFVDLVIVCALACVWMFFDARRRGANPWPYIVVTVLAGCIGPLLYLLPRAWGSETNKAAKAKRPRPSVPRPG